MKRITAKFEGLDGTGLDPAHKRGEVVSLTDAQWQEVYRRELPYKMAEAKPAPAAEAKPAEAPHTKAKRTSNKAAKPTK